MKLLDKLWDWTPKWLLLGLAVAAGLHAWGLDRDEGVLRLAVATATADKAKAERELAKRIAAEATAVAEAVKKARAEEEAAQQLQQEKIDELRRQNRAAAGERDDARERLRILVYGLAPQSAAGPGGGNLPPAAGLAARACDASHPGFQAASGELVDRLLQLTVEADEAVRERNTCVAIR